MTETTEPAPVSQTSQLYDNLRAAILTLDIAPGERISERGLEARFHASRTPVRAALSRLEREGLILHEGRSWTVTPIDLDEIASLAELRGILEPAAARLAVGRATEEQLAGLPQALVITGQADVLRDEGEAYAAKLRRAGVPVTAARYQGVVHDFVMVNSMHDMPPAKAAVAQAVAFLTAALAD